MKLWRGDTANLATDQTRLIYFPQANTIRQSRPSVSSGPRILMRYVIAAIVSALILAGGFGWCRQTRKEFWDMMRAEFERAKAAGELPPETQGLEFDEVKQQGFGTELPGSMIMKLNIADMFRMYWFVFVILVCGISFGVAHWMGPKAPTQESSR